jgi:hypothetical protein
MEGEHAKMLQIQANGTRKEKTTNLIKKKKQFFTHLSAFVFFGIWSKLRA